MSGGANRRGSPQKIIPTLLSGEKYRKSFVHRLARLSGSAGLACLGVFEFRCEQFLKLRQVLYLLVDSVASAELPWSKPNFLDNAFVSSEAKFSRTWHPRAPASPTRAIVETVQTTAP